MTTAFRSSAPCASEQFCPDRDHSAAARTFFVSARAWRSINAIIADKLSPADTTTTPLPNGSISSPKKTGANACAIREGAPINPKR